MPMGPKPRPPMERFLEKVVQDGDCRIWTGATDKDGYALFGLSTVRRCVRGHRWYWEQTRGPIPDGMMVCHSCDRPPCIEHLFLGTAADNNHDRDRKGRTSLGEVHYAAKVNAAQVAEMRARHDAGELIYRFHAEYGISYSQAKAICAGRKWKSVPA